MNWTLKFLPEAEKDLNNLAGNQQILPESISAVN